MIASYKFKKNMDSTFKSDAFLYLAFIAAGFTSIAQTFWEKIACVGVSVLILIVRSFVKKYLFDK
jgi:hypothetical protein